MFPRPQKKLTNCNGNFYHIPHIVQTAPSDYHLFRSMEHYFHGKKFNNVEDVKNACIEFFASKSKDWYREGIKQLAKRWEQAIVFHDIGCKHYILNTTFFIEHPNIYYKIYFILKIYN